MSVDGEVGEPIRVGDRFEQWDERPGVGDALVRPVLVVEDLEITQRMQQVPRVPDQGSVEQLAAAGPHQPACCKDLRAQSYVPAQ
jgi:hypothetical protein